MTPDDLLAAPRPIGVVRAATAGGGAGPGRTVITAGVMTIEVTCTVPGFAEVVGERTDGGSDGCRHGARGEAGGCRRRRRRLLRRTGLAPAFLVPWAASSGCARRSRCHDAVRKDLGGGDHRRSRGQGVPGRPRRVVPPTSASWRVPFPACGSWFPAASSHRTSAPTSMLAPGPSAWAQAWASYDAAPRAVAAFDDRIRA